MKSFRLASRLSTDRDSKRQLRFCTCSLSQRRSMTSLRLPLCVTMNARDT